MITWNNLDTLTSFKELENVERVDLVKEWSERNLPLSPDEVPYGSNKLYWWKGSCGHEWEASAKARSAGENTTSPSNRKTKT